jgi:hypothetical protein
MDRDTAVSIIKGRLARWSDTVLTDHIIAELQAAQQRLEGWPEPAWFLLTESSYTTTTIGEERIGVPLDFIMEVEADALWIEDTEGNWTALKKDDYDEIRARWPDTGLPRRYALMGSYFRLRPAPDIGYTLHMIYYGKDDALTTNMENKWLKYVPDLLISEAGYIIASRYVRNEPAAAEFKADVARARDALLRMNQARRDANRTYGSDN